MYHYILNVYPILFIFFIYTKKIYNCPILPTSCIWGCVPFECHQGYNFWLKTKAKLGFTVSLNTVLIRDTVGGRWLAGSERLTSVCSTSSTRARLAWRDCFTTHRSLTSLASSIERIKIIPGKLIKSGLLAKTGGTRDERTCSRWVFLRAIVGYVNNLLVPPSPSPRPFTDYTFFVGGGGVLVGYRYESYVHIL